MSIFQLFYKGEQNEHIFKQKPPDFRLFMHYHYLFFAMLSLRSGIYRLSVDTSNHTVFFKSQFGTGRIFRCLLFGASHTVFFAPKYHRLNFIRSAHRFLLFCAFRNSGFRNFTPKRHMDPLCFCRWRMWRTIINPEFFPLRSIPQSHPFRKHSAMLWLLPKKNKPMPCSFLRIREQPLSENEDNLLRS